MDRKIHNNHYMIEKFLVTIFLLNQKMAKVERVNLNENISICFNCLVTLLITFCSSLYRLIRICSTIKAVGQRMIIYLLQYLYLKTFQLRRL